MKIGGPELTLSSDNTSLTLSLPSAYERDFLTLLIKKLQKVQDFSGKELCEVQFYKRREGYLQKQLEGAVAKIRRLMQDQDKSRVETERLRMGNEDYRSRYLREIERSQKIQ